jgi:sRNA-binding protein
MHERKRGAMEAGRQLKVLQKMWPLAFPVQRQDVRPLALGAVSEIAAAMNCSIQYALGVLTPWKMAASYCRAVLVHDQRIALDGTPAEPVDAEAKDMAAKQLAKLAARNARKAAPAAAEPKSATTTETPTTTLRDRVRAGLLRRRA